MATEEGLQKNEALLRQAHEELETRLRERTAELSRVNELLSLNRSREKQRSSNVRQQGAVAQLGERALRGVELFTLMDEATALVAQTLGVEFCKILELLPDGTALLLRAGVGWKEGMVGHGT